MDKILSFVINEENKLLILKGGADDPQFHESFWYTVTGSVEPEDNDFEDAVKREIKEETNLDVISTKYINLIFKYNSLGTDCVERAYFTLVKNGNIILNEESIDYKWVDLDEYVEMIKWYSSKTELKEMLETLIAGKTYYKCEKIMDC